jgi:Tol biopolymer transport system component
MPVYIGTGYGCPDWSADGSHIVYVAPDGVHVVGLGDQIDGGVLLALPGDSIPSCPSSTGP